ncbi:Bacterial alpha-L-rhamnosidase [Kribbella qitaiheensis]|uniref:alpha-L-rhamnosidase n=1 Tax=Kribbella qitaiheensis TaxID=1544730 RepID=A0A7G6WRU7_9ACTN|nr:family 78 glycoside hydrolase catalytic domain [Kribbella qitaiheensis]QNE16712.1 Bacterial alpha-L-rhamnosidase [Kribbella qitaiheensis]
MQTTAESPAPQWLRVEDHDARQPSAGRALSTAHSSHPRLSWVVPLVRQGQRQIAYRVIAAAGDGDPREIAETAAEALLLDTGRVESAENAHVRWPSRPIVAHSRLRWAVQTWDEHGTASCWSEPAELVLGPLELTDWTASWVAVLPTKAVRRSFRTDQAVARATLHLAGHGQFRAAIDGTPVNADACDPSRTALSRATVRSYDVSSLLESPAEHVVAVAVGIGHYRLALQAARVLAELVVEFADGSVRRIGTGPDWRYADSPVTTDEPFYLEAHDARRGRDWASPGADSSGWPTARPAEGPETVTPDAGPPVCVVEEIVATRVAESSGAVYDVGRNVAARSRVVLHGVEPGTEVEIVHGEKLDAAGQVDTLNIRLPDDADRERQLVRWICRGDHEVIEAWFAVHGFRYVEVRGLPAGARAEVVARVLHSDLASTGCFQSDDALLDRMVEMAARTQRNNTHSHPEDCPTREQGGWTGDASVSAEAAFCHLDMAGVYRHWLTDVMADQRADGGILGVTPHLQGEALVQPADPVWGSAMTEIPLQHWRSVGDPSLIELTLPAMRRWVEWQLGTVEGGVVRHADISYGADWLAPEQTPPILLQTAAVIRSLRALAELERAVGNEAHAADRDRQADDLVGTSRSQFRDPVTGKWGNGSQASGAVALISGMANGSEQRQLTEAIAVDMHHRDNRLSSGFAGTQSVVRAMSAADGGISLLDALHQPTQPGIGSMLVDGPGTFWETWWIDDGNVGVASLDHVGLAAPFAAWAWRTVAGIAPLTAGYRRFAIAPRLLGPVGHCRAQLETGRGRIEVVWQLDGTELTAELVVPVGAVAVVSLPGVEAEDLLVDGRPARDHPRAKLTAGGTELESGRYLLVASGVERAERTAAIGAAPDVPPGGSCRVPVMAAERTAATIKSGWKVSQADGQLLVTAGPDVTVGDSAELALIDADGRPVARRTVRAGVSGTWLSNGVCDPRWTADDSMTVEVLEKTYVCTPVYHGPIPSPVIEARLPQLRAGETRWLRLPFADPVDLGPATVVHAEFDLCGPYLPGRTVIPVLRITTAPGERRTGTTRALPVSWNRVAVDVAGWPGAKEITEIAVGLVWKDVHDWARGPKYEIGAVKAADTLFRVGRVGWTSAPRTW